MVRALVRWTTTTRTDYVAEVDVPEGWEVDDDARITLDRTLRQAEPWSSRTTTQVDRSVDSIDTKGA